MCFGVVTARKGSSVKMVVEVRGKCNESIGMDWTVSRNGMCAHVVVRCGDERERKGWKC